MKKKSLMDRFKLMPTNRERYPGIAAIVDAIEHSEQNSVGNSDSSVSHSIESKVNNYLCSFLENINGCSYYDIMFNRDIYDIKNVMNYRNDYFLGLWRGELSIAKYIYYNNREVGVIKCRGFNVNNKLFEHSSLDDLDIDLDLFDNIIKRIDKVLFEKKLYILKENGFIEYKSFNIFDMYIYLFNNFSGMYPAYKELKGLFDYNFFYLGNIYNAANYIFIKERIYLLEYNKEYISKVYTEKKDLIEHILNMNHKIVNVVNLLSTLNKVAYSKKAKDIVKDSEKNHLNDMTNEVNTYADNVEFIEYYCFLVEEKSEELICHRFLAARS